MGKLPRALLAIAVVLLVASVPAAAAGPRVEQTEELLVLRVTGSLEDVLGALKTAVERRNYVLSPINDLDDALRRRAGDLGQPFGFAHYKILSFCNLTFADEALRVAPHLGALMPCRAAVYALKGSREVVIVTVRPSFLAKVFRSPELGPLAARVEADVLAIFEMIAGD